MRSVLVVVAVAGIAAGLAGGLAWKEHRADAAEERADSAEARYARSQAAERRAVAERRAADSVTAAAVKVADSTRAAAADSLDRVKERALSAKGREKAALAAAVTLRDTSEAYRALYAEASADRDRAIGAAESFARAAGRLRAIVAQDSVEIARERRRTADWKETADSLARANVALMKDRRPEFSFKVGAGGAVVGAVVVEAVRLLVGNP